MFTQVTTLAITYYSHLRQNKQERSNYNIEPLHEPFCSLLYISSALARRLDRVKILKRIVNKIRTWIKGSKHCSNSSHANDTELESFNKEL